MFKNITFQFIVLFVLCAICVRGNDKSLGDSCHNTNSNEPGTCVLLKDCPKALADIQVMKHPQICGFQGAVPIVCCSGVAGPGNPERKPGDISDKKCWEYGEVVYEIKSSNTFSLIREKINATTCTLDQTTLVIGGVDAKEKEFPHMALLGYQVGEKKEWKCGGTLISEQFVLTAGHCIRSQNFGTVKYIRLGELNIARNDDEADPQDFDIIETVRHPKYLPPSRYNDIALVKMDRPVKFNLYIRPACLHLTKQIPKDRFIATGWGLTERGGPAGADHLQKVILDGFSQVECSSKYLSTSKRALANGIDAETQLCAGGKTEEKDTCQGDSGGPLQIFHKAHCMYSIVGVTSFGKSCGVQGSPGVYTRVSHYIDWIEKIVWP